MPKTTIEHRTLTQAELAQEAAARFGPDPMTWAFQCPRCSDVATPADFPPQHRERIGQECVGRHRGALQGPAGTPDGRGQADRGCDWTAYGLIPAPWTVTLPNGHCVGSFPLAPAPSPTQEVSTP